MTEQEYLEYWKSMSADELIVRCGLYVATIAKQEKELATRNEDIGRLQGENGQLLAQAVTAASLQVRLDTALARIAELEAAQELVQVDKDEDLHDPINEGGQVQTMYSGTAFILTGYVTEADCIHLPKGYCIAKVQPAA